MANELIRKDHAFIYKNNIISKHKLKNEWIDKAISNSTWREKNNDNTTILFYSFNQSYSLWDDDIKKQQGASIFTFNQEQVRQSNIAMQSIADVANIQFIQASQDSSANLLFLNYDRKNVIDNGYAYYPNKGSFSPIWINYMSQDIKNPTKINFGGHVIIHEIGHTLGLHHTHSHGHTRQVSVMSYLSEQNSGADYGGNYPSTPQLLDIATLQSRYGANTNNRTGDTTYGFNSNSNRPYFTAEKASDILIFCVWDAGGIDTFDFSGYGQNQNINLEELSFSDVGGLTGNISIAAGVCIENAIGGSGDDKIWGNSVNNKIAGGHGADQLWGKGGSNTFVYYSVSDSLTTSADTIHDFKANKDSIDLSALGLDENKTKLVNKFSHNSGTEIMQNYDSVRDITYLMINFDNNQYESDMLIQFTGRHQLSLNNFIVSQPLVA
ncbi:M57 family metalloprotease [Yersinia alsatica]|uniref:M57 family metalloprotease n=1 Tax=Yersinia alsatica TaxID=2890317 RepID=UPI001F2332D3|nr:M57 family metalloprotease [Yersinia alsatica]